MTKQIDWQEYELRVEKMEAEGMTRSDAQAVVDAEMRSAGEEIYSPYETVNS